MANRKRPIEEYMYRRSFVANLAFDEAAARLSGFYQWLISESPAKEITQKLMQLVDVDKLLSTAGNREPPKATTPEEVAAVGIFFLKKISEGAEPFRLSEEYGITPSYNTSSLQDYFNEIMQRYLDPTFEYIEREISNIDEEDVSSILEEAIRNEVWYPPEIEQSLKRFLNDHPHIKRNAFIMMKFGKTQAHERILSSIRITLEKYGISGLRSDDREYHDDLFGNVLTYLHGCSFGISVFERLEANEFNPNVSLEVGYMRALRKSVCLLKDRTLTTLHTDLAGKLYKEFDPQDPENTIPIELEKWLRDKDIIVL
jgi:hypothetical protein